MPASVTVQIVLPAELIQEIDEHIRRIAALGNGTPTRSALLRHWLSVAAPQMREALERAERGYALAELERQGKAIRARTSPAKPTAKTAAKPSKKPPRR